jgi:hypothetical protein
VQKIILQKRKLDLKDDDDDDGTLQISSFTLFAVAWFVKAVESLLSSHWCVDVYE